MSEKDLNKMEYNNQNKEVNGYNSSLEIHQEEDRQDHRHNKNARATAAVEPNYPRINTSNI